MKPNFNEYIQYYLTDFEWLIILACLWKPFGPKHFLSRYSYSETEELLQTVQSLHSLDSEIYPLERKHYYRWKEVLGMSREAVGISVRCRNREALSKWLADYMEHYKNERILGVGVPALRYAKSMQATLHLLAEYEDTFGKNLVLRREIDDGNEKVLKSNSKSRLFEDLFILGQQELICFTDIQYAYGTLTPSPVQTDIEMIRNSKKQLILSCSLLLAQSVEEIQKTILPEVGLRALATVPSPYNQFEIKRINPLDESSERIYHNGKELELMPNKQEYRLLHLLVRFARPISYVDIVKNMPFRPHHDQEGFLPESSRELEQRFIRNLKNYCSKLRPLLCGVAVINEHQQIYLK